MIELRPYQREACDAVHAALDDGCTAPAVGLPTGTGKTVVFSDVIRERAPTGRAVVLAHRDELLRQAAEKYREVDADADVGFVQAGRFDVDHSVVVASVQTLAGKRRLDAFPFEDVTTWVVDEAHHAVAPTYRRILERRRADSLLLGVSATLERGDKVGLGAVWERVVYLKTLQEMIEAGYLVDIRAFDVRLNYDLGRLRTSHGDFVASQVEEVLDSTGAYSVAANAWLEHAAGRPTIAFTPTIDSAHQLAATFRDAGVPAEAVDGIMPLDERRAIIARLKTGETTLVANAMVLTEGFDEPSVACIIVARPTKSRPLYVQMVGRGTRLHPGKADLVVLDLVGNTDRVDLVTLPRLFGLKPGQAERDGAASAARSSAAGAAGLYDPARGFTAAEADLFNRKDINWLRHESGRWLLSLGKAGELRLVPLELGKWAAVWAPPGTNGRGRRLLARDVDIGYAMGVAEEWLRANARGATALVDKSAPWRRGPVSGNQLRLLKRLEIPAAPGMTAGEASDLITAATVTRGVPA